MTNGKKIDNMNINNKKQDQRNSFWNMVATFINALESVVIIMLVSRVNTLSEAGMATLGFSIANLFCTIGKFGMKNYQIAHEGYDITFNTFLKSRWVTVIMMIIALCVYYLLNITSGSYTVYKTLILAGVCFWYGVDAFEDVYLASFQARGRLDIGNKIFIVRWIGIMISFFVSDLLTGNLLLSLGISCALCFLIEVTGIIFVTLRYDQLDCANKVSVGRLLIENIPLFIAGFAAFYITNISKYMIDLKLDDTIQAIYGYIAMPVFVIATLNNMIYQPQLMYYITDLRSNKIDSFIKRMVRQILIVAGILAISLIGAYLIGIQTLSILYGIDLSDYKAYMLICLIGGTFYAIGGFMATILTVMDKRKIIMLVYLFVIFAGTIITYFLVDMQGMSGAVMGYLITMITMGAGFVMVTVCQINKWRKNNE